MIQRLIVAFKDGEVDVVGERLKKDIENFLKINVDSVRTRRVYTIDADLNKEELGLLVRDLFVDPITECLSEETGNFDWLIEVGYKPGVTDNVGRTSANVAIPAVIKRKLKEGEGVYTSIQYLICGKGLIENIWKLSEQNSLQTR